MMISDERETEFYQFLIFMIVDYLIDPHFITLYRKKDAIFETSSQNHSRNFVVLQFFRLIRNL